MLAQVPELLKLRHDELKNSMDERPLIIWEPLPASCKPENRSKFIEACACVDVFSPNHLELRSLYSDDELASLSVSKDTTMSERDFLGLIALSFHDQFKRTSSTQVLHTMIVRAGEYGSLILNADMPITWIPPFYDHESSAVQDPTGAGNAFLGGYVAGLHFGSSNTLRAVHYGAIAASFALEQIGLPKRSVQEGLETWNGSNVEERLHTFEARLDAIISGPVANTDHNA